MKYLALVFIRIYWLLPEKQRRRCLFRESCSRYVYRMIKDKGFIAGCKALKKRVLQCRPGYVLYKVDNRFELQLKNGSIIPEDQIAERLLPPYNTNYTTIEL